jgi:sugar phosphate isomerase/epimerase
MVEPLPPSRPGGLKFAVFTVALPEWTPEQAVDRLAAQGWDGIEWRVLDAPAAPGPPSFWSGNRCTIPLSDLAARAPALRQLTIGAGLEMPSLGTYARCDDPDEVELALAGAVALGVPRLRIRVPELGGPQPYPVLFSRARAQFADIAQQAAERGVRVLVETHHRTIVSSPSAALRLLDGLDPAHVGVLHDVGNMVYEGGEDLLSGLELLGPFLAHVHVKNGSWFPATPRPDGSSQWEFTWAPMRSGQADLQGLFAGLHRTGYEGWVSCEDFSTERPLEERLADDLAFLRRLDGQRPGAVSGPRGWSRW